MSNRLPSPRSRAVALACALAGALLAVPRPARADDLQMTLEQIRIDRTRAADGDRPYVMGVMFRSRHNTRGSTSVWIQEREPHDWVDKPRWNPEGARDGHLHAGDTRALPAWMGTHVWSGVSTPHLDPRDNRTWAAVARSEVLGVILITMDNGNTPPHVVRGVLERVARRLAAMLRRQIESGAVMRSFVNQLLAGRAHPAFAFDTNAFSKDLFSDGEKADLFLGFTVGSTFDPDVVVGVQAVVIPAIAGLGELETPADQQLALMPGRPPVTLRTLVAAPTNRGVEIVGDGDGASYRFTGRIERRTVAVSGGALVERLVVRVETGKDDLRGGGDAVIRAFARDGSLLGQVSLNERAELKEGSTRTAIVTLGHGAEMSRLGHVTISLVQGPGIDADNWNIRRVQVNAVTGGRAVSVMDRAGVPLERLTRSRPTTSPLRLETGS